MNACGKLLYKKLSFHYQAERKIIQNTGFVVLAQQTLLCTLH